jgi:predicted transcriptional regulator
MELHIGSEIKRVMEEKGIQPEWLAQKINTSRRNLYDILQRQEISTGQLLEISRALDYDFFQLYQSAVCEPNESYKVNKPHKKVSVTVELDGLQTTLDYWLDVLKKMNTSL